MRIFVKLMALIVVAALAGPFFIKGPDGRPLMTLDDVHASTTAAGAHAQRRWQQLTTRVGRAMNDERAGKVKVHRWRDADGQWHYTDEAPVGGDSEVLYVDPNASRMDPVRVAPPREPMRRPGPADDGASGKTPLSMSVPGVIDDARAARDSLAQRNAELERKANTP